MKRPNPLEEYVVEQLKQFDRFARRTKASGASTEIGDTFNKYFYVEAKQRSTKNVTIVREVWMKLLSKVANSQKWPIYVLENKFKDRFVVMDADQFFLLLKRGLE